MVAPESRKNELISLLQSGGIFSNEEFYFANRHSIIKFFVESSPDLYRFNFLLLSLRNPHIKDSKSFFEKLMKVMSANKILLLSLFLNPALYYLYELSLLYGNKSTIYKEVRGFLKDEHRNKELMEELLNDCKDEPEIFKEVMAAICGRDLLAGKMPFFYGEEFLWINFLQDDNSCFFSFNFSAIGEVSTIIKSFNNETIISIFADEEVKCFMEQKKNILRNNLKQMSAGNVSIAFYNSKKFIDKIAVLCNNLYSLREFDIKI